MQDAGEKDAANASFNECLAQYQEGKVAMWYDATVAAGLLEAERQPGEGQERLRAGAGEEDEGVGLAVELGARDPEETRPIRPRAWKYISWATGPAYIKAAGSRIDGRLGGDPAGDSALDVRDPAVQEGGEGVRREDARRR